MRNAAVWIGLVGLLGVACSTSRSYVPESHATATLGGRTAASYPLSDGTEGKGNVRVASFGISNVKSAKGQEMRVVHVRLAVANEGSESISLDTHQQRVQLSTGQQIAPAWAKASVGGLPILTVPQASSRTVDLFFPLPQEVATAKTPPRFDVVWRVDLGGKGITRVTPFDEVAVDPAVAKEKAAQEIQFGAYDWYDPWYGPGLIGPPAWGW